MHCQVAFIAKTTVTKFCSQKCASKAYKLNSKKEKIVEAQKDEYNKSVGIDIGMIQSKDFLSIKEACILLGISRMSFYRYIKNGKLKQANLGGRVLIKRELLNLLVN